MQDDPLWYKTAVFYELYVRGFQDGNGDGQGDFRGLTERLDYLQWLGIDCIWLLPINPSPLRDGGYDVSDYFSILPDYGTLGDFYDFLEAAHARGLRVIADMVMNHTSDQHPWFQESRKPGSAKRDWYVWSDTDQRYLDARIIFVDTETSNWTWDPEAQAFYWHRFFSHQPDLNYDNPEVQDVMIEVIRFWLDMGLDGFRLDAVPYMFEREGTNCENLPETHEFLKRIRKEVDDKYPGRVLLAEANQWPPDVVPYFGDGDECHSLLYSLPGSPVMYYGDEIGMGDNIYLGDRDGVRTPMQWTGDRNAGFSRADPAALYLPFLMDPVYGYQACSVEAQERVSTSLLQWVRRMLQVRKQHPVFGVGDYEPLYPDNRRVLAFYRQLGADVVLVVANLSRFAQPVELDLSRFGGLVPEEMFGRTPFPLIDDEPYRLGLGPHGFYWFHLVEPPSETDDTAMFRAIRTRP
jgi:glycosidase